VARVDVPADHRAGARLTDWDRLPAWLEGEIAKECERLTSDLDPDMTMRLRERVRTYRKILKFGEEVSPEKTFRELVDEQEHDRGYR
jgi:hypothetical protein